MATKLERATRMPRDQRRAQLLDAANEVFTTKGYHAAAMDDIADESTIIEAVHSRRRVPCPSRWQPSRGR